MTVGGWDESKDLTKTNPLRSSRDMEISTHQPSVLLHFMSFWEDSYTKPPYSGVSCWVPIITPKSSCSNPLKYNSKHSQQELHRWCFFPTHSQKTCRFKILFIFSKCRGENKKTHIKPKNITIYKHQWHIAVLFQLSGKSHPGDLCYWYHWPHRCEPSTLWDNGTPLKNSANVWVCWNLFTPWKINMEPSKSNHPIWKGNWSSKHPWGNVPC